jgi:hypothetical protein
MKKVPWARLIPQVFYLASILVYMFIAERFSQVYESMNMELPFMFYLPGLYLHPAVVTCAFALFLWNWKNGRLENKLLAVLCNLPILTILAGIFAIFSPIYSGGVSLMGSIYIPPTSLSALEKEPLFPRGFGL